MENEESMGVGSGTQGSFEATPRGQQEFEGVVEITTNLLQNLSTEINESKDKINALPPTQESRRKLDEIEGLALKLKNILNSLN